MVDISTSGWDVVSVTDLNTINKIINTDDSYPKAFSVNDSFLGIDVELHGSWGEWMVSNNASGGKINIKCYIEDGKFLYADKEIELNGEENNSFVEVELLLKGFSGEVNNWLGDADVKADDAECFELKIDDDQLVIVADYFYSNDEVSDNNIEPLLQSLFKEWFTSNLDSFRQIFAVVLIGLKTKDSDFDWIYPSAYSYAANSSIDGTNTGFGVLTLIDGDTDIGDKQQSIDISALDLVKRSGGNLALIISKAMFVKHILLDAAVSLIKGSNKDDFTLSESGLSITNNREMVWQDFESSDGSTCSPVVPSNNFVLTLQSDYIHLSILGAHYRAGPGVTVYMSVEQNFRYTVAENEAKEPIFVPDETGLGDASVSCSVKFDQWLNVLEITMGVITSVASLVAIGSAGVSYLAGRGAATLVESASSSITEFAFSSSAMSEAQEGGVAIFDAAAAIASGSCVSNPTIFSTVKIASSVTAALTGVVLGATLIAEAIYKKEYKDVPSFHHIANLITNAAVWPNTDSMTLKSANLADSFVIGIEMK